MPPSNRTLLPAICALVLFIALVISVRGAIAQYDGQSGTTFLFAAADGNANPGAGEAPSVPAVDTNFLDQSPKPAEALPAISLAAPSSVPAPVPRPESLSDIITADSYLVANLDTGKIYFEKDPDAVRPIASISKLFSALVAEKDMDQNAIVTVASSSITGYDATTSPSTISPGESFSLHDILYDMLLVSSNDAATSIADNYEPGSPASRGAFVSHMNAIAASIGLTSTSFGDPSGLSQENVSSASDLFKLAQYLYHANSPILAITKTPEYDVATTTVLDFSTQSGPAHGAHKFSNIDPFVYDPHYIGGKTGRTDAAGETMLSMFNLPSADGTLVPVAIIVLHSDLSERQIDSSILVGRVIKAISGQ